MASNSATAFSIAAHFDPKPIGATTGEQIALLDCELETLRRAAIARHLAFDASRRTYTCKELHRFGMVREGYTREELRNAGVGLGPVTSFDELATKAEKLLPIETPFGSGISKWQLPFDMMPLRVMKTRFPANTRVEPHVHPAASMAEPGGSLRIVTKGCIVYNNRDFRSGDWFYIPNGEPYTFTTDPHGETECFYTYGFFAWTEGNRFSHPHAADHK